jgi:hypothetical protein
LVLPEEEEEEEEEEETCIRRILYETHTPLDARTCHSSPSAEVAMFTRGLGGLLLVV